MTFGFRLPWRKPFVPALRLSGVIGSMPWRGAGLTLAGLERLIDRAFSIKQAPAVVLLINSPGGSPVQSSLIAGRIRRLADERKRPVLAFVEDIAASGGYWLACAADEIFADRASIVGSIGVISAGFGFQDALERLGVERRVHASGPSKGMLDPFRPERPEDLAVLREVQDSIYAAFREHVRARRGDRLKGEDAQLFDGRVWTGDAALRLGLIDGLAEPRAEIRRRFGAEMNLVPMMRPRPWLQRRLGLDTHGLAAGLGAAVEERALWARYGL